MAFEINKFVPYGIKSGANMDLDKYQKLSSKLKKKFYLISEEEAYLI